jgi:hypothetical protein
VVVATEAGSFLLSTKRGSIASLFFVYNTYFLCYNITMSRPTSNPEQVLLFDPVPSNGKDYETWQKSSQPTPAEQPNHAIPTIYGKPGSYVDLHERAKLLTSSLQAIGKANQRVGFVDAAEVPPHRSDIWGRYARNTPRVIEGADRNRSEYQLQAKNDFWKATGLVALQSANMADKHTRDAMGRTMWRDFSKKFGGVGQPIAKRRQKAIRSYAKQTI